jgi:hypothetical protein
MRRDLECSIWSEREVGDRKIAPPIRGHRIVRIPAEEWLAFTEWCLGVGWETSMWKLADLCTKAEGLVLRGEEIRELAAEAAALSLTSHRPEAIAAHDRLLSFLKEATDVLHFYDGEPYVVKVVFR